MSSCSFKDKFEKIGSLNNIIYVIRQFQSLNLWKPPNGVLDHAPRNRECNETLPQMVLERGNAYCVGVKVDASVFENHL